MNKSKHKLQYVNTANTVRRSQN